MFNLYLADIYKMRKSITMKVLFVIAIICAVAVAVMAYLISNGNIDKNLSGINFLLSDVSMVNILGAVIAGVFVCGDFDNRSIHEAIANGNSRGAIIISKAASFSTALLVIILPYAIVAGIAIGTGSKFSMDTPSMGFLYLLTTEAGKAFSASETGKLVVAILTLSIVYIGQLSVCLFFAMVIKKPVVVVALNYALGILSGQLQTIKGSSKVFDRIFACTPFGGNYGFANLSSSSDDIFKAITVSVIFTIVILSITYVIFRRSEIK